MRARPRLWTWGLQSEEPSYERRVEVAAALSARFGVEINAPRIPSVDELDLRAPRLSVPASLAGWCRQDTWERAYHSYGFDRTVHAVFGRYPNPPDVVAHPRDDAELAAVLDWCGDAGIARQCGGTIDDGDVRLDEGTGQATGHGGAVGAWRQAFIPAAGGMGEAAGLGLVTGTFETAITWDRWPDFDRSVRAATVAALRDVCGGGTLNCRFTHVYTDGPAPYYTYTGAHRSGADSAGQQEAIKAAASDAIMAAGGTITHHHAVGRQHRPWYDEERPEPFADALRAAKRAVDPKGILNPGVLIDP